MRCSRFLLALLAAPAVMLATPSLAQQSSAGVPARPIRGPWKPDLPLAKAYDASAKALAMADANPLIRWEYRVWCETGYRLSLIHI